MSNYLDEDNAGDFRDVPDEVNEDQQPAGGTLTEAQTANAIPTRRVFPTEKTVDLPSAPEIESDDFNYEEAEEDFTNVLSDARLRLEQGRLYELVMNSDLFVGSDCDPKAIKNVEKEIRNFAKERMEIMLGMRQEASKEASFPLDMFPFNALEVEALKALASAATKGASAEAEPFVGPTAPPRKNTLNPISVRGNQTRPATAKQAKPLPTKPTAPVKRTRASEAVQRILEEEGVTLEEVNQVFDPNHRFLTPEELDRLTPEQMAERNRQSKARLGKTVPSRQAVPMPTQEHMDAIYSNRANQAAQNPQMQMIMNLLDKKK